MSYTTDLAIELQVTGTNAGTWGQITNTNLVLLQQAIAGYQAISIAGGAQTTALAMTQSALGTARNAVLKLTGTITGNQIVTVPNNIDKTWIISNGTVGAFTVTFKYASTGSGQTWSTTDKGIKILYADGTDIQVTDLSTLSGSIVAAQITNSTITQAKLAANSVGANQIIQSTITQAKLAANSVGANQLIATAVTPATYTAATITVDADGRITGASSGSAGAGGFVPAVSVAGPASGTFTQSPGTNRILVFAAAGGGGNPGFPGGEGGDGGYGMWNVPQAVPYSAPYSVGAGGANSTGPSGGAGGPTTLGNIVIANGGSAGTSFSKAPNGTAPGSNYTAFPAKGIPLCGDNITGVGQPGFLTILENNGT
jgi:hypothetical protein